MGPESKGEPEVTRLGRTSPSPSTAAWRIEAALACDHVGWILLLFAPGGNFGPTWLFKEGRGFHSGSNGVLSYFVPRLEEAIHWHTDADHHTEVSV